MSYMDRRKKMAEIRLEIGDLEKRYKDFGLGNKSALLPIYEKRLEVLNKRLEKLKTVKGYNE